MIFQTGVFTLGRCLNAAFFSVSSLLSVYDVNIIHLGLGWLTWNVTSYTMCITNHPQISGLKATAMLDFTNESAIWLEHSGNSSFLLQVPSTGAAWSYLGVTQWLGWNNLELQYLAVGAGCQLGPQGIFSQSFGTWAFRVVYFLPSILSQFQ